MRYAGWMVGVIFEDGSGPFSDDAVAGLTPCTFGRKRRRTEAKVWRSAKWATTKLDELILGGPRQRCGNDGTTSDPTLSAADLAVFSTSPSFASNAG